MKTGKCSDPGLTLTGEYYMNGRNLSLCNESKL